LILSLFYFVNIIGIISIIIYFIIPKTNVIKSILPIVLLVAFSSVVDVVLINHLKFDSEKWSTIYLILEFISLMLVFIAYLGKYFKRLSLFFLFIFFLAVIYFNYFNLNYSSIKSDGFLSIFIFIYIIVFSIQWFISEFKKFDTDSLLKLPFFYLITGLILYHSGSLFLFLMREEIKKSELSLYEYWVVNLILVLFFRILLIVSIWKGRAT
jgi:hypothetical protein